MNFLAFIHHLLNPHCPDCRAERREQLEQYEHEGQCKSCDTLIRQLEIANHEKEQLLAKLLREPTKEDVKPLPIEYKPPRQIPWAMRRQMLEQEDREAARLKHQGAAKADPIKQADIKVLEIDLGVNEDGDGTKDKDPQSETATG